MGERRLVRTSSAWAAAVALAPLAGVSAVTGLPSPADAAVYREQQGSHGADTFTNYHNASGKGPRVEPWQWVEVSCKVYDPYIQSANPDGYWYRLASPPWNNQYYAVANTFMNGDVVGQPYTHNTDFNVPDCGSQPSPTTAPPPSTSEQRVVSLAQGPTAPDGYRYAVTIRGFTSGSQVSVSCHDSADPGGFYTFTLQTDASGSASTSSECYSNDGPEHWVNAGGVESNRVRWGPAPPAPTTTPPTSKPITTTSPPPSIAAPKRTSMFFSPNDVPTGLEGIEVADLNVPVADWAAGNCQAHQADDAANGKSYESLASWSKGRLGAIYYLMAASSAQTAAVDRVVLFDPGSLSDMEGSWWKEILEPTCDHRLPINSTLASWLKSDGGNRLIVFTGRDSQMKPCATCEPTYAGLWKHYFADIWNQPFADQSVICNYDDMDHAKVLREFSSYARSQSFECPDGPGRTSPWHP